MGLGFISRLFLAAHYLLWFESSRYTFVTSSTIIVKLQPLFSIISGYFLFTKRAITGCLIAISGDVIR